MLSDYSPDEFKGTTLAGCFLPFKVMSLVNLVTWRDLNVVIVLLMICCGFSSQRYRMLILGCTCIKHGSMV